uniref:Uncharacterized protein n=1 Tax=Spongospora subterranea TaxID=70186 RepID=A0A0H5QGX7_9EUKA|eukprot:CRZ00581.1 hypothetical protein [Spongospora subterranea]
MNCLFSLIISMIVLYLHLLFGQLSIVSILLHPFYPPYYFCCLLLSFSPLRLCLSSVFLFCSILGFRIRQLPSSEAFKGPLSAFSVVPTVYPSISLTVWSVIIELTRY